MQGLKILVVVMGVMIVAGVAVVVGTIIQRSGAVAPVGMADAVLTEPPGTQIVAIATVSDRLALQLKGGGPDRVLLIDPRSGRVAARISLTP